MHIANFWKRKKSLQSAMQIDPNKDLYIHHHLGLGDMIHCNGMVRSLLDRLNPNIRLHVFCKERHSEMVSWMYRDEPRIIIETIDNQRKEGPQIQAILRSQKVNNFLCVGHRAMRPLEMQHPELFFDQLFYLQLNVPYEYRFSRCYWERDRDEENRVFAKLAPDAQPYAFVHDDPQRGFVIPTQHMDLLIVKNDVTESIFSLCKLLENATEVHCMESSIRCMMESLDLRKTKLYYHNFRYPDRPLGTATCLPWKQISYARVA